MSVSDYSLEQKVEVLALEIFVVLFVVGLELLESFV